MRLNEGHGSFLSGNYERFHPFAYARAQRDGLVRTRPFFCFLASLLSRFHLLGERSRCEIGELSTVADLTSVGTASQKSRLRMHVWLVGSRNHGGARLTSLPVVFFYMADVRCIYVVKPLATGHEKRRLAPASSPT